MPKSDAELSQVSKLLKFLPEYGVLICKPCQFAIQPSALSSHLLRHQIYRSERKQLLQYLTGFDLNEPEDVALPEPESSPILDLPVYRGFYCEYPSCGHACASEKRMAQHWSDQHGSREVAARTTWLQTFFRGNKIRYFEVSEPNSAPTPFTEEDETPPNTGPASNSTAPPSLIRQSTSLEWPAAVTAMSSDGGSGHSDTSSSSVSQPHQLSTLDLQLMHHWSTCTAYTIGRGSEPSGYWTTDVVKDGFDKYDFLLYGLLSTAAFHLASEHRFTSKFQYWRSVALEYQGIGLRKYNQALKKAVEGDGATALIAFNRIISVTRCAEHHLDPDSTDSVTRQEWEGKSLPILECIMLLRGATDMFIKLQQTLPAGSAFHLPPLVLAGLQSIPFDEAAQSAFHPPLDRYSNIPLNVYDMLFAIPQHLLNTTADAAQLSMIKHAFASLAECFNRSYAVAEVWTKWNAVEAWPRMVSEGFLGLIERCHPGALVQLALWALLVKRLEVHNWYLQGETRRLFRFVREPLGPDLRALVDEIAACPV